MKAVIVEIEGNHAIALNKKGDFIKVKKRAGYNVGYEVDISSASSFRLKTAVRIASMAAAFLLILGVSIGAYCYSVPYTFVNVDINPSVEITANVFNRIIKVEGINEDGKKLLENMKNRNKSIEEGIGNILNAAVKNGYLKDKRSSAVLFTVSGKSEVKVENLEQDIKAAAAEELKTSKIEADVLVQHISLERHNKVKKTGVSPGKQNLIDELRQLGSKDKEEDLQKEPVKQLTDKINALKNKTVAPSAAGKTDQEGKKAAEEPGKTASPVKTPGQAENKGTGVVKKAEKPEKGLRSDHEPNKKIEGEKPKGVNKGNSKQQQNKNNHSSNKEMPSKLNNNGKGNEGNKGQGKEKQDINQIKQESDTGRIVEDDGDNYHYVDTNTPDSNNEEQSTNESSGSGTANKDNKEKVHSAANSQNESRNGNSNGKDNGNSNGKGNGKK